MAHATRDPHARLFAALRQAQAEALHLDDANEHARARARLLQAVDSERALLRQGQRQASARPSRAGWRWAAGTLVAAACAFAVFVAWPGDRTLEFEVDGVQVSANQLIVANEDARVLDFSDDTRVELAPHSKARVGDLRSNGAIVTLEQGTVSLSVHHESDTSWQVAAGPWQVFVTGTQFTVAWEPEAGEFAVEVREGSVRVEGPEGEVANLRGGDSLFRARGKATIDPENLDIDNGPEIVAERPRDEQGETPDEQTPDEQAPEQPGDATQSAAENDGGEAAVAGGGKAQGAKKPSWRELYDGGDYAAAWTALEKRPGGIAGEADRVDAATMLDLADLARFNKSRSEARTVLERLRERFPSSEQSSDAAFMLGKIAADGGDRSKAAVWFETYLDERPDGSLAADALSRLMDSYTSLDQLAKAKSAAKRYLDAQPKGPHADKARKILGQ